MHVYIYDCNYDTCLDDWPDPDYTVLSGENGDWVWNPDFTGFENIGANENFNGFNLRGSCDADTQILWIDEKGNIEYAVTDFDIDDASHSYLDGSYGELEIYPCYVEMPSTETYNVTYSCGTGSGTPPAATTAKGDRNFIPLAATDTGCSKTGYTISGWLVSGTSDIKQPNKSFKWEYTSDKTLTAQCTMRLTHGKSFHCATRFSPKTFHKCVAPVF